MVSCSKLITDLFPKLSYSQKLFAEFVLQHKKDVLHMSIAELAETLGIAPSTIIAATKRLGFTGFRDFQISLASEQTNPIKSLKPEIHQTTETETNWYQKTVETNIAVLQKSLSNISSEQIRQTADILLNASCIYIYGVGTSAILAKEAYDFLFRLGLNCVLQLDPHYQYISISLQKDSDVSVLVSQSGINRNILEIAERIKNRNHRIIGISNYTGTPFAKYCDILLAALPTLSTIHENHFSFRIPILCIIEALYYALADKMGDRYYSAYDINRSLIIDTSVLKR